MLANFKEIPSALKRHDDYGLAWWFFLVSSEQIDFLQDS